MNTRFTATHDSSGFTINLVESYRSMLRKRERELPVNDWVDQCPSNAIDFVALLNDELSNEPSDDLRNISSTETQPDAVQIDANSVRISHHLVARLSERQANAAGLPKTIPLTLMVDRSGPLTDVKTKLSPRWSQRDGRVARPKITGCIATLGDNVYRMPLSLYQTAKAIESFNAERAPDINTRLAHLAHLKDITSETDDPVSFERRLSEIRLSHAHSFSLEVVGDADNPGFNPILNGALDQYGRQCPLLSTKEQQNFSSKLFTGAPTAKASYFISNNHYLFVSPELLPALNVIRDVQNSEPDVRREFLRSPAGFIRSKLEESGQISEDTSYVIDQLFVETDDFSDRVTGIGLWEKKNTPDFDPGDTQWIPNGVEFEKPELEEAGAASSSNTQEEAPAPIYGPDAASNEEDLEYNGTSTQRDQDDETLEIPDALASTLRVHQKQGLVWLQLCWQHQRTGALLADDMGVGKTIQTIAFMRWLQEKGHTHNHGPLMVVAPVSLLDNWQNEIDTHLNAEGLGNMALLYADGLKRFRLNNVKDINSATASLDVSRLKQFSLLLTTYETLRDYSISLGKLALTCIVFDEMQKVKKPTSLMTRASKAMNAQFTLGLTGTPIENTVVDLWCMLDTLIPGEFGSRNDFLAQYGAGASEAALFQLGQKLMNPPTPTPPYLLRRMKNEIGEELPPKTQQVLTATMPSLQQGQYDRVLSKANPGKRSTMLTTVQQMRNVSLHPGGKGQRDAINDDDYIAQSARMTVVFEALDNIAKKQEKALLFVESLDIAARLAVLIRRRYKLNHTPARISGSTPAFRRQHIVNEFSTAHPDSFDVLVLSPKAAGVGLNIVAANHVIHLTRWWNPAVEDQCTDRAYRFRQDKPVTVYLPLSLHADYPNQSFDELLHEMLEKKRSVAQGVLFPGETGHEAAEILRHISETLTQDNSSTTKGTVPADNGIDGHTNPQSINEPNNDLSLSLYPDELSALLKGGIRSPAIGLDIDREDGAIFTNLEWAWSDEKVGLADTPPEEELLQLKRLGWRVVTQIDEGSIGQLKEWLL